MAQATRAGVDKVAAPPGVILPPGANSVLVNGIPMGVQNGPVTPPPPIKKKKKWVQPHPAPTASGPGASSVIAEGKPAMKTGQTTSCGRKVVTGSPDVFIE